MNHDTDRSFKPLTLLRAGALATPDEIVDFTAARWK